MTTETILITVRTQPVISKTYMELVCTAGITDAGEWRRLYPVPHRLLEGPKQYRTFDVVEVAVGPGNDGRPETRRPQNETFKVGQHLERRDSQWQWIKAGGIHRSVSSLASAGRSIGAVAVKTVLDFTAKKTSDDWTEAQKQILAQGQLFGAPQPLQKIPYDFRLSWIDMDDCRHDCLYHAWEVGETWRQWTLQRYDNVIDRMREKWLENLFAPDRRVFLFMGNHHRFRQQYMVCGHFAPPDWVVEDGTLW